MVDAHVKALAHAKPKKVGIYNVGTGKGDEYCCFLNLKVTNLFKKTIQTFDGNKLFFKTNVGYTKFPKSTKKRRKKCYGYVWFQ